MPSSFVSSSTSVVTMLTKLTVVPNKKSTFSDIKLSVSDLPMLSCHYIQKGLFFPPPPIPINPLFSLLATSLSRALSSFPPLAGRLFTDVEGRVFISSTDAGSEFSLAAAPSLNLPLLLPPSSDVPIAVKSFFFPLDSAVSHDGHFLPLSSFQLTQLGDGAVFLACTINHAVLDGTSFWNFFNAWAELCRSPSHLTTTISRPPNFIRNFFPESSAVLRFHGADGPAVTFPVDSPIRERIFHFRRESIQELKAKANHNHSSFQNAEAFGKFIHDRKHFEISSFQSLCAQLWRSVTRARKNLRPSTPTTFRMAVNCRRRVAPPVDECYFGNAIQSIPTTAAVGEVAAGELSWIGEMLRRNVAAHGDEKIRKGVAEWEKEPRCFPLGNPGGAGLTMGSSPRFPMYERNDFGWGEPVAVRSGKANKFDGKISAFPGREGGGSVDLEVCLAPETMAALLQDMEFMHYVEEEEEVDAVAAI